MLRLRRLPCSRSRFAPLALLGALALAPACKGEAPKQDAGEPAPETESVETGSSAGEQGPAAKGPLSDTVDSAVIAERGPVVATAQLPSGVQLADVAAVLESIQPGASTLLVMQLPKLLEEAVGFELADAKLTAPLSIVVVDPSAHPEPLAVLVEAKDPAALQAEAEAAGYEVRARDGRLLIGKGSAVAAAESFAFEHLLGYPDHTELIVYPAQLLAGFEGEIAAMLDQAGAQMQALDSGSPVKLLRSYAEGAIAVGRQTDRVVFSVAGSNGNSELIARVYPLADTTLASFVTAQVPADHALLAKLPSPAGSIVMSGELRAGAARAALVDFGVTFMSAMYGGSSPGQWAELMNPWLDQLDGRFAASVSAALTPGQPSPAMDMRALMGTPDSAALRSIWREMLAKMAAGPGMQMMGMKVETKQELDVLEHDGVSVDLYATEVDTSAMPADQQAAIEAAGSSKQKLHMAAFDQVAAMATADEEGRVIRTLIDAARGKGETLELSGDLAQVFAASKQRGDSVVFYFDLSTFAAAAPGPQIPFSVMSWTVGKQGEALDMRLSLRK